MARSGTATPISRTPTPRSWQAHRTGPPKSSGKRPARGPSGPSLRLGTPQGETSYWGKLDGSLSANGSATVSIYWHDPLVDSGNNVTAYAPPLMTSGTINSGKWVEVTYRPDAQKWYHHRGGVLSMDLQSQIPNP